MELDSGWRLAATAAMGVGGVVIALIAVAVTALLCWLPKPKAYLPGPPDGAGRKRFA
jgi:hypothetical protein